ncbi:MAG TPA: hypothetical protein VGO16_05890 [Pseudonocardiaceae bacterium]|jgi:hypothetical protein|nr:hypothetical protein [Pseudonocardiaceae bacterium]
MGHPVAVAGGLSRPLGVGCGHKTLDAVIEAGLDSVIGFNIGGIEVDRDPFAAVFDRARAAGLHSVAARWRDPRPGPYLVGHSPARSGTHRPRNPLPQ